MYKKNSNNKLDSWCGIDILENTEAINNNCPKKKEENKK